MRNHGLLAFVLTTAILVPAAVHHLQAGHDQVVKFAAPASGELALGKATIKAKLEHPLVDPGETMKLDLAAVGGTGKALQVGVLVYGSSGTEGDRVPSPPVAVAHKNVTIPLAADGTGSAEVAFKLKGAELNRFTGPAFAHYTVMVMSPSAADRLADLRDRTATFGNEIPEYNKSGERFMAVYAGWGETKGKDATLFAEGAVAKLSAHTRAINPTITLDTPTTATTDTGFLVGVTVKNPSKKLAANGLQIELSTPTGVIEDEEHPSGITATVVEELRTFDLAPGETKHFQFRVLASDPGILGLYAKVSCQDYDCKVPDGLTRSGTFDATEIKQADKPDSATTPIVGSK